MKFDDLRLGICTCKHITEAGRACLLATHYDDGGWAFTCGENDHSHDGKDYIWVDIEHLIELDSSLHEIADLPRGWFAEREELSAPWERHSDD